MEIAVELPKDEKPDILSQWSTYSEDLQYKIWELLWAQPNVEKLDQNNFQELWTHCDAATLRAICDLTGLVYKESLLDQLNIVELWDECDADCQETIWQHVETLLHYGVMYTTYTKIPSSIMSSLNTCVAETIQSHKGKPMSHEDMSKSLQNLTPKMLASIDPKELMKFSMQMMQNPDMMQEMMGMMNNVQNFMPGMNMKSVMGNMIPGGIEA